MPWACAIGLSVWASSSRCSSSFLHPGACPGTGPAVHYLIISHLSTGIYFKHMYGVCFFCPPKWRPNCSNLAGRDELFGFLWMISDVYLPRWWFQHVSIWANHPRNIIPLLVISLRSSAWNMGKGHEKGWIVTRLGLPSLNPRKWHCNKTCVKRVNRWRNVDAQEKWSACVRLCSRGNEHNELPILHIPQLLIQWVPLTGYLGSRCSEGSCNGDGSVGLGSVSMTETAPRSLLDPTISGLFEIVDPQCLGFLAGIRTGWTLGGTSTPNAPQLVPVQELMSATTLTTKIAWLHFLQNQKVLRAAELNSACVSNIPFLFLSDHLFTNQSATMVHLLNILLLFLHILFMMVHTHTPIDVGSEKGLPNIATYWNTQKQS